jgi:DNA-binding HxlR family transcriptional regulator
MPIVTPRDVDIFRTLASGPMTEAEIRRELKNFRAKDPKRLDDGTDGYTRNMTTNSLQTRMSRLRRDDYIVSRLYPEEHGKGTYALYALTPRSIEVLVREDGVNIKHIRSALPGRRTVSHERHVVDIVKTIKRGGSKHRYAYDIEDENYLKALAVETGELKKGLTYPDLHVTLCFRIGLETVIRNFAVEMDNGSILESKVCNRAHRIYLAKQWLTMIICPGMERINKLRPAFARYIEGQKDKLRHNAEKAEMDKYYWRTFFAITREFHENGFLDTKWMTINGGHAVVVPPDFKVDP